MVWRLLLVVLLVGFSSGVSAQEKSKKIVIQKRELEGAIKLKWNITDEGNWLEIIRKGFVLERKEVRRDGKLLLESKPIVLDTLKIAPKKEWLKFDPVKNKYIAILSQALFGESFQVNAQSQSFINQIKQQKNDREQRFSVGNLSLSTDFNAAILGGSAYIDSTVNQESEYVYRIKSLYAPNNKEYQGIVLGSSSNYKPLNKPIAMEGVFGENKVNLGWRLSFENKPFIAYEIQVMGEDSVFVTVNKNLIIPDIDPNMPEFMKKSFYSYSYPNNSIEQKYSIRYRGLTDFSEWSPYSEILVGSPVHKLTINPTILEIKNLTELKGFDLEWEYPSKELYRVKDIELEYAKEMYSPYTTVATGDKLGILGDVSIISIKKAMKTGYYRLRLKGYHKEYTLSMPKKIIVPNTIPPEAPVGLNAKKKQTDEYTVVRLKWKPNKEWDLLGYRIYRSTEKDGDYKLVDNNRFFEEAKYTDYVSKASGVEAYYYSIRAVDQNYNHSKLSESVKVSIFEETKEYPIKMLKKEVSQDAIEITFRIPEGKQTKKFSLYRKTSRSDFSQFVQDFEIEKGEREFSFVDTYIQDDTYYSYFGISFYESGKISKKQYFPLIYVPKKIEEEMPFSVNVDTDKKGIYRIEFSSFTIKGVKIYVCPVLK